MTDMTKSLCACCAALVLGSASAQPGSQPVQPMAPAALAELVDANVALIRAGRNVDEARGTLEAILDSPAVYDIDAARRQTAFLVVAFAAAQANDMAHAHALMRRASELEGATPGSWSARFVYAIWADDVDDALVSATRVAEQWPDEMQRAMQSAVYQIVRAASRKNKAEANLRLLSALFENGWRTTDGGEPSELWRELARLLLERGDMAKATEVVGLITSPETLVRARADRRFDPLLAARPDLFNVAEAAWREVKRLERAVGSARDRIQPMVSLVYALEASNRCDEALQVAEQSIARAGRREYVDSDEYFVWLLDYRARALACLGRWDEALQQRVEAATISEYGQRNTSQVINLASLYNDLGRPAEALQVIDTVGNRSDFGNMQEQSVRFEAYLQLGDAEKARAALAFMREHRNDAFSAYQSALLEIGDMEAAADLLIQRLDNPYDRVDVLHGVQRFAERLRTPIEERRNERWEALLARADVRAAVERVGRIESYPSLR